MPTDINKVNQDLEDAHTWWVRYYQWCLDHHLPGYTAADLAAKRATVHIHVPSIVASVFGEIANFLAPFAAGVLKGVSEVKDDTKSSVNQVIAASLEEVLGVDVTPDDIPHGHGIEENRRRAQAIGNKLHNLLTSEFGDLTEITPERGAQNARVFSGFGLNLAISNSFIGLLGELLSLGQVEEFRELGEEVIQVLGLGRLQRLALQPLIRNFVQQPYDLYLKSKLRPDRLSEAEYVRAMQRGTMSQDEVKKRLAEKGYPDAEIDEILIDAINHIGDAAFVRAMQRGALSETEVRNRLKQKGYPEEEVDQIILDGLHHLSDADLSRLVRYGEIPVDIAQAELIQQGIPREHAEQILKANTLTRVDSIVSSFVNKLESQYINGFIDEDAFNKGLEMVPLSEEEKQWERNFVGQALDAPQTTLSFSQVKTGIVNGILDFEYLDRWLLRKGYSDEDQLYLEYEILQAMDKATSKAEIADGKAARRVAQSVASKVAPTITRT